MVATSPVTVSAWLDSNQLRLALCADFDTTIATRLTSMERVEKYARRCPVAGAEPADYRLREVQLFPDVAVLAGIHFRNLQLDRPFIGVYAQTRLLTDSETVEASKRLRLEFAGFAPKYVSWWSPEQHDLRHAPGAISDKRLIVGHLRGSTSHRLRCRNPWWSAGTRAVARIRLTARSSTTSFGEIRNGSRTCRRRTRVCTKTVPVPESFYSSRLMGESLES